jgi:hypothetical protein
MIRGTVMPWFWSRVAILHYRGRSWDFSWRHQIVTHASHLWGCGLPGEGSGSWSGIAEPSWKGRVFMENSQGHSGKETMYSELEGQCTNGSKEWGTELLAKRVKYKGKWVCGRHSRERQSMKPSIDYWPGTKHFNALWVYIRCTEEGQMWLLKWLCWEGPEGSQGSIITSPRDLLEMQILEPHPRSADWEASRVEAAVCVLRSPQVILMLKFEMQK